MDISTNLIDLMYLTNHMNMGKLNNIKENKKISNESKKKYKDVFLELTNKLMNGIPLKNESDNITMDLVYTFNNYFKKSVGYFDFLEKQKIIQERYKNMENKKEKQKKKIKEMDIGKLNINIMRKKKKVKMKDLNSFVKKKKKNKKKMHIPKQLDK